MFRNEVNEYEKKNSETSNGDVGIIKDIKEIDGEINVFIDWDNGKQTMENRETMADISLAYAISIHKSQGRFVQRKRLNCC